MNSTPKDEPMDDSDVPIFMDDEPLRLTPEEMAQYLRMRRRSTTVDTFVNSLIESGFSLSRLQEGRDGNGLLPPLDTTTSRDEKACSPDDTQKPKSGPSPVFLSPKDLPPDLPPPRFMTKRASSEDFHRKCADMFPSTLMRPKKKENP